MQSEQIDQLAAALNKAQSSMSGAVKDTANPFFKSRYADLESVWEACRGPLVENGLSVSQTMVMPDVPGTVVVRTTLMHTSGQWISGDLCMKPVKEDPQAYGSCITYARRYALAAIVGVYQMDDDGESASGRGESRGEAEKKYISDKPSAPSTFKAVAGGISEGQSKLLYVRRKQAGKVDDTAFEKFLIEKGWKTENAIPKAEFKGVLAFVEGNSV